ncbi:hypothetical protein GF351_05370, partial [Candidatus Woesearchaeota archaeon]|nr:hypothetical protein [Candidatus Woesearchaeota archaeon]
MKKTVSLSITFLFLTLVFIAGCVVYENADDKRIISNIGLTEEANLPAHCIDGKYNEGEKGLDCGWSCPNKCKFTEKIGRIERDETWSGNVHVLGAVVVPEGVTLTIKPGTVVKFKHDRNYKTYDKGALYVEGGIVKAIGTKDGRIWFTSDAPAPINGDWQYIRIEDSDESEFDYTVIEFGEGALWQFDSQAKIAHSIIRWACYDALYAERSGPMVKNNLLYSNGYHEIALEQYNDAKILDNVFKNGKFGVHHEKTTSYLEGNLFINYSGPPVSGGMESNLTVIGNMFVNITNPGPYINVYEGSVLEERDNHYGNNTLLAPKLGFEDIRNFEIDYMPGDPEDKFQYVYDDVDETRKILKKIGTNLSFGWTLEYVDGYLYRFS